MANFPVQIIQNNVPLISEEVGIAAVKDDGSPEGIMKVKIQQGELIKIPITNFVQGSEFQSVNGGSASVFISTNQFNNGDGTASALNMNTVSAGLGSNFCLINTTLYGKVVGVRFRRIVGTPSFSVVIDGVPYDCPAYILKPYSSNTINLTNDRESVWIVDDTLEDRQHTVQIFLYPDAAVSKTLVFYGFSVEKRVGYKEIEKNDFIYSNGTLTASSLTVPTSDYGGQIVKNIKTIIYQNTDSVARVVNINYNDITISKLYLTASGTSGDTINYNFGSGINLGGSSITNGLSHYSDVAGKVNFVTIGKS
jgi:hypothetical protein